MMNIAQRLKEPINIALMLVILSLTHCHVQPLRLLGFPCDNTVDCGEKLQCIRRCEGCERTCQDPDAGPLEVTPEEPIQPDEITAPDEPRPEPVPEPTPEPVPEPRPEPRPEPICPSPPTSLCFAGDSKMIDVGICKAGERKCEGGVWGKCVGEVLPSPEICDGKDNDCDGKIDNDPADQCHRLIYPTSQTKSLPANIMIRDKANNLYITGQFQGQVIIQKKTFTPHSAADIFAAKFDAAGTLLWFTHFGKGFGQGKGTALALDSKGNLYITGAFEGKVEFSQTYQLVSKGGTDIFIAKLSATGVLQWARREGNAGDDIGASLAITAKDEIIITGSLWGPLHFSPTPSIGTDWTLNLFIAKLTPSGTFTWSAAGLSDNITGFVAAAEGQGLALDATGHIYACGYFKWTTLGFSSTKLEPPKQSPNSNVGFVAKFSPTGGFVWAERLYGKGSARCQGLAIGPAGKLHVYGIFIGTMELFGKQMANSSAGDDFFITRLDTSHKNTWQYQSQGSKQEGLQNISFDSAGNLWLTGFFTDRLKFGVTELITQGKEDIFLANISPQGSPKWAISAGGKLPDFGNAISISNKRITLLGTFQDTVLFGTQSYSTVLKTTMFLWDQPLPP